MNKYINKKARTKQKGRPFKVTGKVFVSDPALLVATHVTFPLFVMLAATIPVP